MKVSISPIIYIYIYMYVCVCILKALSLAICLLWEFVFNIFLEKDHYCSLLKSQIPPFHDLSKITLMERLTNFQIS